MNDSPSVSQHMAHTSETNLLRLSVNKGTQGSNAASVARLADSTIDFKGLEGSQAASGNAAGISASAAARAWAWALVKLSHAAQFALMRQHKGKLNYCAWWIIEF